MKKRNGHYLPLEHGQIEALFPDCFLIRGTMQLAKLFQYSRNMVILRQDNALALVNPIRLDDETERKLLGYGSIEHIFKIGALHSIE